MRIVTPSMAKDVARSTALSLIQMLKPDGSFIYRYLLLEPNRTDSHYNNIRHIASVWFLLEVDKPKATFPSPVIRDRTR
jgi:hypothetical protein